MSDQSAMRTDLDTVWRMTDSSRLGLVDLLRDLRDDEWDRPSLCSGWSVRHVAAHLALAHIGVRDAMVGLVRAAGSVDRMTRDTARRHATAGTDRLIAEIGQMVGSRRLAPGVTPLEPLLDALVHGQDIAIPLGRSRPMPVDAAAAAASRVWTMRWPLSRAFPIRDRLRNLRLVATDAEWSAGRGNSVEGPIEALLLLMTGRTAAVPRLRGTGMGELYALTGR